MYKDKAMGTQVLFFGIMVMLGYYFLGKIKGRA